MARGSHHQSQASDSEAGPFFNKVTQWLAWAAEFLNIPLHPERAGNGEGAEGKEEEKQETWEKREGGKLKLKTDARVHPLCPSPPFPQLRQSEATVQPFPQSGWGPGGSGKPTVV
jgi:hypothetical protein